MLVAMVEDHPSTKHKRQNPKSERVEARVTEDVKLILERAANLQGRTLTDFVVSSAYEAATRAISVHNQIVLTARGTKDFVEAVLNPREPSDRLKEAAARYKKRMGK